MICYRIRIFIRIYVVVFFLLFMVCIEINVFLLYCMYFEVCDGGLIIVYNFVGNEEVKRGIFFMLFGGVLKIIFEKINFRGDINICVVGDLSIVKS